MKNKRQLVEVFLKDVKILYEVKDILYEGKSSYQHILIANIESFGKSLFLNGVLQSAQIDENIYHEVLVHPVFLLHPYPEKILILGGGEGATLREILKYDTVKEVVMVEIDKMVVEASQKYLPEWSLGSFGDNRLKLIFDDAFNFIHNTDDTFDIIVSDLTDPFIDPLSIESFTEEFFSLARKVLRKNGLIVVQGGTLDPHYQKYFKKVWENTRQYFKFSIPYGHYIFSFLSPWGFLIASNHNYFESTNHAKKTFAVKTNYFKPELFDVMVKQATFLLNRGVS